MAMGKLRFKVVTKSIIELICFHNSNHLERINPVEDFYKDSTVLITGATGFLGTVLVEKLFRCFDVKKIYLFVRSKNGESASERIKMFTNQSVS